MTVIFQGLNLLFLQVQALGEIMSKTDSMVNNQKTLVKVRHSI